MAEAARIIILYYSRNGATQQLADAIANGVSKAGAEPVLRTVSCGEDAACQRDLVLETDELADCAGLIMGSPTRFGHMYSGLQKFWEQTSRDWLKGSLVDKPAAVFTSSGSMHGGQESTLLAMGVPLLHQGMVLMGIPYTAAELHKTEAGGSPYGASHVEHAAGNKLTNDEHKLAEQLGERVAKAALKLSV